MHTLEMEVAQCAQTFKVRRLAMLKSVHLYCKKSSNDFPSAGILHNSVDFVTPSMWFEADSADVCRLNVKHSKISVLIKPATTLIGALLKIQFEFFFKHMVYKIFRIKPYALFNINDGTIHFYIPPRKNENNTCLSPLIFASQGLRSALLIFTLGIVRGISVITAHCHLLDFDSYAPCNDVIFSQSTLGFHFLSFECPENLLEIIIGSVSSYKPCVRIV